MVRLDLCSSARMAASSLMDPCCVIKVLPLIPSSNPTTNVRLRINIGWLCIHSGKLDEATECCCETDICFLRKIWCPTDDKSSIGKLHGILSQLAKFPSLTNWEVVPVGETLLTEWMVPVHVGGICRTTQDERVDPFSKKVSQSRFDDILVCDDGDLCASCISRTLCVKCRFRPGILRSSTDFQYEGSGIVSAGFRDGRFHQPIGGREV